jgi:hypothetical protein
MRPFLPGETAGDIPEATSAFTSPSPAVVEDYPQATQHACDQGVKLPYDGAVEDHPQATQHACDQGVKLPYDGAVEDYPQATQHACDQGVKLPYDGARGCPKFCLSDPNLLTTRQRRNLQKLPYGMRNMAKYHRDEETWKANLNNFMIYKEEFHTMVISKKDVEHQKLYSWVARQRRSERLGTLSAERKHLLLEVGFIFEPIKRLQKAKRFTERQVEKWEAMYVDLCGFNERRGHCKVSHNDEENRELAKWVSLQRVAYSKKTLDESRKRRLDDVGFAWNGKSDSS